MRVASLLSLLLTFFAAFPTSAQQERQRWLTVFVDSAFVRAQPGLDADATGSVAEGQVLQAVGRNADGLWFEIVVPGSRAQGWISSEVVAENFEAWEVPITSSYGIEGSEIVTDAPLAVYLLANARLREDPFISAEEIISVPFYVTLPVLGRNQDGSWVYVNYRGYVGWLSESVVRGSGDIMSAPLNINLPPLVIVVEIIPPELQQVQLDRLREYVTGAAGLAQNLADYWWLVTVGEIVPCTPPPFTVEYQIVPRDVQELPELNRLVPRLNEGIDRLNEVVLALQECGVYTREEALNARNNAINANVILNSTLGRIANIQDIIDSVRR
jgi:uncharacterized protein YgiM (DUF1202 family)